MLKPSWPFKAVCVCGNVCCTHGSKMPKRLKLQNYKGAILQQTATTLHRGKGAARRVVWTLALLCRQLAASLCCLG